MPRKRIVCKLHMIFLWEEAAKMEIIINRKSIVLDLEFEEKFVHKGAITVLRSQVRFELQ